jgi:hypothetical protein
VGCPNGRADWTSTVRLRPRNGNVTIRESRDSTAAVVNRRVRGAREAAFDRIDLVPRPNHEGGSAMKTRKRIGQVLGVVLAVGALTAEAQAGRVPKAYVDRVVALGCSRGNPADDYYIVPCGLGQVRGSCMAFLTKLGTCDKKPGGDSAIAAANKAANACYKKGKADASIAEALNARDAAAAAFNRANAFLNCNKIVTGTGSVSSSYLDLSGPRHTWLPKVKAFCLKVSASIKAYRSTLEYQALTPDQKSSVDSALGNATTQVAMCQKYVQQGLAAAAVNPANAASQALAMAKSMRKKKGKLMAQEAAEKRRKALRHKIAVLRGELDVLVAQFEAEVKQLRNMHREASKCAKASLMKHGAGLLPMVIAPRFCLPSVTAETSISAAQKQMYRCVDEPRAKLKAFAKKIRRALEDKTFADKIRCAVDKVLSMARDFGKALQDLGNLAAEYKDKMIDKAKELWNDHIKPSLTSVGKMLEGAAEEAYEAIKGQVPEIGEIEAVVKGRKTLLEALGDTGIPGELAKAGRKKVVNYVSKKLAAFVMKLPVVKSGLSKLNGFLLDAAYRIVKHPVSRVIGEALAGAINAAVTFFTAGAGAAVAPVLQPVLARLGSITAEKLQDWAWKQVKAKVNHFVFKKTRPLLEKYVLRPVIGAAVDLGINVLRQKFPELRL